MELFEKKWGQWIDLSTTSYIGYKYVLQARRHKNGKLQYRVEKSTDSYTCANPTVEQLEKVKYKNTNK
jgi:hypothetical protein